MKKLLRQDGWDYDYSRGDHHYFRHPIKLGKVTISGNDGDDMPIGTERAVIKQAQLER